MTPTARSPLLGSALVALLATMTAVAGRADDARETAAADAQARSHAYWARAQGDAWEAKIGARMIERAVRDMGGRWESPEAQERAEGLGRQLVGVAPPRDFEYRFFLVDSPDINAGALLGGHVILTRGLLAVSNDAELAGCIAHEVAHIDLGHGRAELRRDAEARRLFGQMRRPDDDEADRRVAEMGYAAWKAGRSRQEETAADGRGQELLLAAAMDPIGQISSLWKVACGPMLEAGSDPLAPPTLGGAPGTKHYVYVAPRRLFEVGSGFGTGRMKLRMQDHPPIENRIRALSSRLRALGLFVPAMGPFMPEDDPDPLETDPELVTADSTATTRLAPGVNMCFPWASVAHRQKRSGRSGWMVPPAKQRPAMRMLRDLLRRGGEL